ncbi:MAG: aminopeptidase, partial [Candidatus Melainabacteria bacterium HGW-Melainabacteria-1]
MVGQQMLIEGAEVRTGVTVILPAGKTLSAVPAGWFALNGNGELTGTAWIEESGLLEGPIALTNTCSVGLARDTLRRWMVANFGSEGLGPGLLPVVGETWDGWLNDIEGQ